MKPELGRSGINLYYVSVTTIVIHPDEYASSIQFPIGNWSRSFRDQAIGYNALDRDRNHDEYSPGLACSDARARLWSGELGFVLQGLEFRVQGLGFRI